MELSSSAISCRQNWQLLFVALVYSSFPRALVSAVEHLYVWSGSWLLRWKEDREQELYIHLAL
jgi:hypothetical protein